MYDILELKQLLIVLTSICLKSRSKENLTTRIKIYNSPQHIFQEDALIKSSLTSSKYQSLQQEKIHHFLCRPILLKQSSLKKRTLVTHMTGKQVGYRRISLRPMKMTPNRRNRSPKRRSALLSVCEDPFLFNADFVTFIIRHPSSPGRGGSSQKKKPKVKLLRSLHGRRSSYTA